MTTKKPTQSESEKPFDSQISDIVEAAGGKSKEQSTTIIAQITSITAQPGPSGDVRKRAVVLKPIDTSLPMNESAGPHGAYVGMPYPGLGGYGTQAQEIPLCVSLSAKQSDGMQTGDWVTLQVSTLSKADRKELAKYLIDRAEFIEKMKSDHTRTEAESKMMMASAAKMMKTFESKFGNQFGDD